GAEDVETREAVKRGTLDHLEGKRERPGMVFADQLIQSESASVVQAVRDPGFDELRDRPILGLVVRLLECGPWHDARQSGILFHQPRCALMTQVPVFLEKGLESIAELLEHIIIVRPQADNLLEHRPRFLGSRNDPVLPY